MYLFAPRRWKGAGERGQRAIACAMIDVLESRVLLSGTLSNYAVFNGTDGEAPIGGVEDSQGNIFGVTSYSLDGSDTKSGVVFEIPAANPVITDLASLGNGTGIVQGTSLIIDSSGNLFGTENGGPAGGGCTIFEILQGTSTIVPLATFPNADVSGAIGSQGTLAAVDSSDNIYGVDDLGNPFEVAVNSGAIANMASQFGASQLSVADFVLGPDGNFYAVSQGSIVKLSNTTHTVQTLASFDAGTSGVGPLGITFDTAGNLWGFCEFGGGGETDGGGNGTVWELPIDQNTISVIANFDSATGTSPVAKPVFGTSGNLYGLTQLGGANQDGTVFDIPGVGSTAAGVVAPATAAVDLADLDSSEPDSSGANIVTASNGIAPDTATTLSSLAEDRLVPESVLAASATSMPFSSIVVDGGAWTETGGATVFGTGGFDSLTPERVKKAIDDYNGEKAKLVNDEGERKREEQDDKDQDEKERNSFFLIPSGAGVFAIVSSPLPNHLEARSLQANSQSSATTLFSEIKVLLAETGKELNVVQGELNQQIRYTAQYNKLGTTLTTLQTQLAGQTNGAAQAKIQAKITADQNAQDHIVALDSVVFDTTASNLTTIDAQQSTITADLAAFPPLAIALSGSVVSVPTSVAAGKKIRVVIAVTDSGNEGASGPLQIALFARPLGTAGDADISMPLVTPKIRIKAGATGTERLSLVVPETLPSGSYSLVAQLDPSNLAGESVLPSPMVSVSSFSVS